MRNYFGYIRSVAEKITLAAPFFMGAALLSMVGPNWEMKVWGLGIELPGPSESFNHYLNVELTPWCLVILLAALPLTYRTKAALFATYFLYMIWCMALPFMFLARRVDDGEMRTRDWVPVLLSALAAFIALVRVIDWVRKRTKTPA